MSLPCKICRIGILFVTALAGCGDRGQEEKGDLPKPKQEKPLIEVAEPVAVPAPDPIVYEAGDSFEGMWNYDRRNANLTFSVRSVDSETRLVQATMKSSDLDDTEKQFEGLVEDDGYTLQLAGIAGTGGDYELVSGYSVRDFLRKSSTMTVDFYRYDHGKLRGSLENGSNLYFWARLKALD